MQTAFTRRLGFVRPAAWACMPLALLVAGGCLPAEPEPPDTSPTVVHVGPRAQDRIDGLDLATGPDGSVHLVWREWPDLYGAGAGGGARIMYRRGHGDPVRWDAPMQVARGVTGTPEVIASREGVHVLAGLQLDHWWLPADADRWQTRPALLDGQAPPAMAFDVAGAGDGAVVAYASGGMGRDQVVYSLRWHGGQAEPTIPVVRYQAAPGSDVHLLGPTLSLRDGRLLLLWGARVLVEVERATHTEFQEEGRVYAAWSADAGRHWGQPSVVNADTAAQTAVHDVAATGTGPAPLALYAAHGLFASRWHDNGWSPPRRLAAYEMGQLSGSATTSHVTAASCAGQPLVAWVDGRHQRSDRRWWNPLGGLPWSDSPDWINNDLFVLTGKQLAAALEGRPVSPQRQTVPGSYTQDVAVIDRGDHLLLVWAGRASVRKSPQDMNAPPMIWQRRIECG